MFDMFGQVKRSVDCQFGDIQLVGCLLIHKRPHAIIKN